MVRGWTWAELVEESNRAMKVGELVSIPPEKTGTKNDTGKPPLGLIPKEAQDMEAQVFAFGAEKYGRDNFRAGIQYTRLLDACLRHVTAYVAGEDLDPESGLPHWAHARCCLSMLAVMEKNHPELDDRYKND